MSTMAPLYAVMSRSQPCFVCRTRSTAPPPKPTPPSNPSEGKTRGVLIRGSSRRKSKIDTSKHTSDGMRVHALRTSFQHALSPSANPLRSPCLRLKATMWTSSTSNSRCEGAALSQRGTSKSKAGGRLSSLTTAASRSDKGSEVLKQGAPAETWTRGTWVVAADVIRFNHGAVSISLCKSNARQTSRCGGEYMQSHWSLTATNGTLDRTIPRVIPGAWVDSDGPIRGRLGQKSRLSQRTAISAMAYRHHRWHLQGHRHLGPNVSTSSLLVTSSWLAVNKTDSAAAAAGGGRVLGRLDKWADRG